MTIREATLNDLDDIMEIERTCFDKSLQVSRSTLAHNIKSPSVDFLVAVDDTCFIHIVVGCIIVFYRKNSHKAYVDSLAVHPVYRRQGIGEQLKDEAHLYAYARGATEIHSDVDINNGKMIALNKVLGYKIAYIKKNYYGRGRHAYRMIKE